MFHDVEPPLRPTRKLFLLPFLCTVAAESAPLPLPSLETDATILSIALGQAYGSGTVVQTPLLPLKTPHCLISPLEDMEYPVSDLTATSSAPPFQLPDWQVNGYSLSSHKLRSNKSCHYRLCMHWFRLVRHRNEYRSLCHRKCGNCTTCVCSLPGK